MYNFDWTILFPTMYEENGEYWFCDDYICWYYNESYREVITDRGNYYGPEAFLEAYFSGEFMQEVTQSTEADDVQAELKTAMSNDMYNSLRIAGMEIEDETAFYEQFGAVFAWKWEELIGSSGATITWHDWQAIWDALHTPIYEELW